MSKLNLSLSLLPYNLAICHLKKDSNIPSWAIKCNFFSITKTEDELSIVCLDDNIPDYVKCEKNWKALKFNGPLDFSLTGVLSSLLNPLAKAGISIFAISTYDTDYLLIKEENIEKSIKILSQFFKVYI